MLKWSHKNIFFISISDQSEYTGSELLFNMKYVNTNAKLVGDTQNCIIFSYPDF